jgi:hypothetical protein
MAEQTTPGPLSTSWPARPEPVPARSGRARGAGSDALAVLGSLLLLGVLCGVLWWLLVDPASYTKTAEGGVMSENQLGKRFDGDGMYVVIAVLAGLVAGLALSWWRDRDPLLTSLLLVVGSGLAAAGMLLVGHRLGPGDPGPALKAARLGALVPERLDVHVWTVYLAWPVAVLTGALVVLLGRVADPDVHRPGPDSA